MTEKELSLAKLFESIHLNSIMHAKNNLARLDLLGQPKSEIGEIDATIKFANLNDDIVRIPQDTREQLALERDTLIEDINSQTSMRTTQSSDLVGQLIRLPFVIDCVTKFREAAGSQQVYHTVNLFIHSDVERRYPDMQINILISSDSNVGCSVIWRCNQPMDCDHKETCWFNHGNFRDVDAIIPEINRVLSVLEKGEPLENLLYKVIARGDVKQ